MADNTTNYNLTKPLETEKYDIKVQNGNMDKLDTAVDGLQKEVTAQKNEYTTLKRNLPNIVVSETRPENPTEGMILFRIIKGPEIPIPVTDYFFRFDASKLYLDDGAKVAQWDDLSVNGNDLIQPNTVSQPTFLKTGLNGKPTVRFNNSFMDISPFSFDKYDTATTFITIQVEDSNDSHVIVMAGKDGETSRAYGLRVSAAGDLVGTYINNALRGYVAIGDKLTFLYSAVYDGITSKGYKDGVFESQPAYDQPISSDINLLRFGKHPSGVEPFLGKISEIVHYTRNLDDAERVSVETYLMDKWGL